MEISVEREQCFQVITPSSSGEVWQTTVLETTTKRNFGLVSGCVPSLLYTKTSSTMTATVCNILCCVCRILI
ncbi:hypothetical protein GBAR_LOCUS17564 [Geodia barretti]|uniref:Uncharacterized protein n=1 Tax=Geodia barretti TaxID=519541 RepID=A0AA35WRA8_GEOBA|nr:hypothetical protein GBAR_LOCUS17564 [Geodia barretti]